MARKIEVAGHQGMVGSVIVRCLQVIESNVCFVHRQFQYARTQEHVIQALSGSRVTPEFICPKSHLEALTLLGEFQQMIDTFP